MSNWLNYSQLVVKTESLHLVGATWACFQITRPDGAVCAVWKHQLPDPALDGAPARFDLQNQPLFSPDWSAGFRGNQPFVCAAVKAVHRIKASRLIMNFFCRQLTTVVSYYYFPASLYRTWDTQCCESIPSLNVELLRQANCESWIRWFQQIVQSQSTYCLYFIGLLVEFSVYVIKVCNWLCVRVYILLTIVRHFVDCWDIGWWKSGIIRVRKSVLNHSFVADWNMFTHLKANRTWRRFGIGRYNVTILSL